jgi:hypothetical protein
MCLVTEWTPNSFVVEHEEVHVFLHLLKQIDGELIFVVSERTHIAIFAALDSIGISLTELGLVLFWVIEVFDSVVTAITGVSVLTITVLEEIRAQFRNVVDGWSSSICLLAFVVVKALFRVVGYLNPAWLSFKCHKV